MVVVIRVTQDATTQTQLRTNNTHNYSLCQYRTKVIKLGQKLHNKQTHQQTQPQQRHDIGV
jgi:hypothetical protein